MKLINFEELRIPWFAPELNWPRYVMQYYLKIEQNLRYTRTQSKLIPICRGVLPLPSSIAFWESEQNPLLAQRYHTKTTANIMSTKLTTDTEMATAIIVLFLSGWPFFCIDDFFVVSLVSGVCFVALLHSVSLLIKEHIMLDSAPNFCLHSSCTLPFPPQHTEQGKQPFSASKYLLTRRPF